jgi:hypothetical protein
MAREIPWVLEASDLEKGLLEVCTYSHTGLMVLQNLGPLSFIIGDSNRKKYRGLLILNKV